MTFVSARSKVAAVAELWAVEDTTETAWKPVCLAGTLYVFSRYQHQLVPLVQKARPMNRKSQTARRRLPERQACWGRGYGVLDERSGWSHNDRACTQYRISARKRPFPAQCQPSSSPHSGCTVHREERSVDNLIVSAAIQFARVSVSSEDR